MFAVYVNPVTKDPDGTLCFKNSYPPADDFDNFCMTLNTIFDCYHLSATSSEIDYSRNCVMILTDDSSLKICVEPNYAFACMDNMSLEEIKGKIDDAINKRITHVCSRCGCTGETHFNNLNEMALNYNYRYILPDGWGNGGERWRNYKLCSSCYKEYCDMLSGFMKK